MTNNFQDTEPNSRPTGYALLAALRKAPNRELWRFLLFDLLSGEQELESYLGHIESYEEIITQVYDAYDGANPKKPQKSEDYFNVELEDIVRGWRPKETKPERYYDAMLRLISAFNPPSGFHRILGQMEQYGKFNLEEDDPEAQRKLTELALTALQNYYLTHPAKNAAVDPAFKAYVRFLRLKLKDQELSPHACRRLIELNLLEVDAEEVAETLRQHPEELLIDLLRAFLVDHTSLMHDDIPKLFVLCLKESLNDARLFLESARKFGASLEPLPFDPSEEEFETPALVTAGDRVNLYLPENDMEVMIRFSKLMKEDLRLQAGVKLEALI